MTRKHFEAIARDIRTAYTGADMFGRLAVQSLTIQLCAVFAESNPRFNRARFLAACAVPDTATKGARHAK